MIKKMNEMAPPKHMKKSFELSVGEKHRELMLNYDNFKVSYGVINRQDMRI